MNTDKDKAQENLKGRGFLEHGILFSLHRGFRLLTAGVFGLKPL